MLSTFHRPENVDDEQVLRVILAELAAFPLPVLLPLHPRTAARAATSAGLLNLPGAVRIAEPLGYPEFLGLAASARSSCRTRAVCRRRPAS